MVTGGAGFIGSHTVVELFHAGYEPVIMDNFSNSERSVLQGIETITGSTFAFFEGDCRNKADFREVFRQHGPFHSVIHFAAFKAVGESVAQPGMYYENNVGSLINLLDVLGENGMPGLVFSSSCTVYGQADELPVTETTPKQKANSPYGYTKQVCEQLIDDVVAAGSKLKAVTLRYFNPIGAHESGLIGELPIGKPNNLIPFITQTAAGLRDKLVVFGDDYPTPDGFAVRDYIHVVDLAQAHVKALDLIPWLSDTGENYISNVGTGKGSSVLEVVHAFEQVTGQKLNYEIGPRRSGDIAAVWGISIEGHQILDWKAQKSLETALKDAWNWQLMLEKRKSQN